MTFKKGQSGNPKGRPKGTYKVNKLEAALKKVGEEEGLDFLEHVAREAFNDRTMAIAVINKLIPNLKQVDKNVESNVTGIVKLAWKSSKKSK